jgi:hypothetical protein
MRRWALIAATPVLSVFLGATAIAIIAALTANACPTPAGGTGDQPSASATVQIPAQLLAIYEQVGAQYDLPWEILAGIATEECDQGRLPDPSCTLQPGATGPGTANPAGASGLMQIGIGGAAGDAYDQLRQYLPNPALGPHDPTTAVQLAALVLIKDKRAPTGQPINTYLPYAAAYNGTGPAATAYASRVIADATSYQGTGQTTFAGLSSTGCSGPVTDTGYVNPFAHAQITPSRIDQGVDYSGTGPIDALGPGRVVLVSTTDTGWGNGNGWISYQLTAGTYTGDYIYVAEGITPTVTQGELVSAGEQIGAFNGHSIEIGFALGQDDLALAHTVYHEGADTAAGRTMNTLLTSLGAPAGHQDPTSCGGPCPIIGGPVPSELGVRLAGRFRVVTRRSSNSDSRSANGAFDLAAIARAVWRECLGGRGRQAARDRRAGWRLAQIQRSVTGETGDHEGLHDAHTLQQLNCSPYGARG